MKRFRQKKNEKMQQARRAENQFIASERHGLRSTCNKDNPQLPLIVNLNFEKGKKMAKKRVNRQVASLNRKLKKSSPKMKS